MSDTIETYKDKIRETIKDDDGILSPASRDGFLNEAIRRYSKIVPNKIVHDFQGDGTSYDFALPSTYIFGFSSISQVEYPADERIPLFIDDDEWMILQSSANAYSMRLINYTPTSSEKVRISFNGVHTVTTTASSIINMDMDAVCNLASALCCYAISRHYAKTADATLTADTIDYQNKSETYASRAKELEKLFSSHINIETNSLKAASVITDWDTTMSTGDDYFTYGKAGRT
jgi:hypothetical protein